MRKNNNHYLIIKWNDKYYDYTQESFGKYFLYECNKSTLDEVDSKELTHYTIGDKEIYIVIEPTSDGERNKTNNQIRLIRNLVKANIGFTKPQSEKIIRLIKSQSVIKPS